MTRAEISIVLMDEDEKDNFHVDVVGSTVNISEAIYYALQTFKEQKQPQIIEAFLTGFAAYSMENNLDLSQLITDAKKRVILKL